jgi:radical SAM protein with 4Fe4S-binding SPASM domain
MNTRSVIANAARRATHGLYRKLETDVHPLRYLFVEITQRCNLDCLHCGSDCTRDTQLDELSTEQWLAFFDSLPQQFDRNKLVLVVTGGEPFCTPRFDELLAGLKRNQLLWGMVTNGFLLSAKNIDKVVAHGLISMTVSIDGLQHNHDWLRGRQGSFERATEGIRRVAAHGLPFFDVVTCVNPRNLPELDQVRSLLIDLGVKKWRLFSIIAKGHTSLNHKLILNDDELRALMDWIADGRAKYGDDPIAMEFSCEGYVPPALDKKIRTEPYFCRAGISIGSVLCDGAISACPNISRELVQGNVRQDKLKDVWEHKFAPFRDRAWMRQGDCVACADWDRCQGNSMHLWDAENSRCARCFVHVLDK